MKKIIFVGLIFLVSAWGGNKFTSSDGLEYSTKKQYERIQPRIKCFGRQKYIIYGFGYSQVMANYLDARGMPVKCTARNHRVIDLTK